MNILELATYIVVGLILLVMLLLLIRLFICNKSDKKISKSFLSDLKNSYIYRINTSTEQISIYTIQDLNDSDDISLNEFLNTMSLKDQKTFKAKIQDYKKNNVSKEPFLISRNKNGNKLFLKISFKSYSGDEMFLDAILINEAYFNVLVKYEKEVFLEYSGFKKIVLNKIDKVNKDSYIAYISFNIFDFIVSSYGESNANTLIHELYYLLLDNVKEGTTIGHVDKDNFVIFIEDKFTSQNVKRRLNSLKNQLETSVVLGSYSFDLEPSIIFEKMDTYNKNIDVVKDSLIYSLKFYEKGSLVYYDKPLHTKYELYKEEYEEFNRIIDNFISYARFYPLYYIEEGSIEGYFAATYFHNCKISKFNELFKFANDISRTELLMKTCFRGWISKFMTLTEIKEKTLFVFVDFTMLELFKSVLEEFDEIPFKLVCVVTDYTNLVINQKIAKSLISGIKSYKVDLGIVANEEMQYNVSSLLGSTKWLIFPSKLTFDIGESNKDKLVISNIMDVAEKWNLNIAAWNLKDFAVAKILKNLGVEYINGRILDNRDNDYNTVRQIADLFSDNRR